MRLSDAITRLQELLQASDTTHWSLRELGSHLNRATLSLCRKMAETDEGYFNHLIRLPAADRRQIKADVWDYTLPPWIERVVEIRDQTETTDPSGAPRGRAYPYLQKYGTHGYQLHGPNLRIISRVTPEDIELMVAKRPARVTLGTLPTQANLTSPATSYVRLDADSSTDAANYPHETLTNSYVNALVEITGQNARSGQFRRVVGSTHFVNEGGTLYTVLQVETPWATQPQAGDTYEMHFEIPDQHMELVALTAAFSLWATRGNSESQKAIALQLAEEMAAFQRHIRPRQVSQPAYLRHTILPPATTPTATEDTRRPLWS